MNQGFETLQNVIAEYNVAETVPVLPAMAAVIAVSVLICLLGVKLIRVWGALTGFAFGSVAAFAACTAFQLDLMIAGGVAVGVGLILAVLSAIFKKVGGFFICLLNGFGIAAAALWQPVLSRIFLDWASFAICAGIGVLLALISLKLTKSMVVLTTAVQGGLTAGLCIASLVVLPADYFRYVIGAGIAVVGIIVQFFFVSRMINKKDIERAQEIKQEESVENDVDAFKAVLEDLEDLDEEELSDADEAEISEEEDESEEPDGDIEIIEILQEEDTK